MWQQAELEFTSQRQIALQAALLPCNFLVQARVLNGDGELRGQSAERAFMVFGEVAALGVFEVEDSDHLVLVDQRNGQFRASLRIHGNVAIALGYIRHQNGFFTLRRIAHHSRPRGISCFR